MTTHEATRRFNLYVWPHRSMVLRTAQFLTHDAAEAEDLAQDGLLKAYRAIDSFDPETNPRAWLSAILRNARIDRVRASAKFTHDVSLDGGKLEFAAATKDAEIDPHDAAAIIERLSDQTLIDALKRLPEDIRWTLLLIDVEQMDYEEAARILNIPSGTVKSRVFRGRRMLKEILVADRCKDSTTARESVQ